MKFLSLILLFIVGNIQVASAAKPVIMAYPGFGNLYLYKPNAPIKRVVIFISGDGGWNAGVANIAFKIKDAGTLVIGVDIREVFHMLNHAGGNCLYPAANFEAMSQFVQKKMAYETYTIPVLMGYSSGATLVYGLLAQAPENTFRGGIVFGFCPDFAVNKPFCEGSGKFVSKKRIDGKGYDFGPAQRLAVPFISLQGMADQICNYKETVVFLRSVQGAQIITLPKVGHGYSVEDNWVPQFKTAYNALLKETAGTVPAKSEVAVPKLPVKITDALAGTSSNALVLLISGDGGFTGFDQQLANLYAQKGMPVIGLNSLKYFWKQKAPQQTATDMLKLMNAYLLLWKKEKVILVGYSFGADVMPFIYNLLPLEFKPRVLSIALLSPSRSTDFEIHVADLFSFESSPRKYSVIAEIERANNKALTCYFGKDEDDAPAAELAQKHVPVVFLEGGHHYTNGLQTVVNRSGP